MRLLDAVKLCSLLIRLSRGKIPPRVDPSVIEQREFTSSGTALDLYRHHRRLRSVWIAVHGVTINGGRDMRLIHFARTLAYFGNMCIVPTLDGLASCRWELRDIDELAQLVKHAQQTYQQPVGMIGFSFGGSYALLAAARDDIARQVYQIVTFGAYYDLGDVFQRYGKELQDPPQTDNEWDEAIYRKLVLLYGQRNHAITSHQPQISGTQSHLCADEQHNNTIFSPQTWQEMESLLRRYCYEASPKEKRQFYEEYLQHIELSDIVSSCLRSWELQRLSPVGKLGSLNCPVTLIHDRRDHVVPPDHSKQIFAELQSLAGNEQHQLVLTSLLSHVSSSFLVHPRDILQFARALSSFV